MTAGPWQLEPIGPGQLEPAADALAEAFFDDPLLTFVAPSPAARRRLCEAVSDAHLRLSLPEGHCYLARGRGGEVGGTICLTPPGRRAVPPTRLLSELPGVLARCGVGGLAELLPALPTALRGWAYGRATGRLERAGAHWYVMVLGVTPSAQGSGAGRQLLEKGLALADLDRLPLFLLTESEKNVRFYEHLGLEVVGREHPHRQGPALWAMARG